MDRKRLRFAAMFFAVFWTGFMVWWTGPQNFAHVVMLGLAGIVAALLWYWLMGLWADRYLRRE